MVITQLEDQTFPSLLLVFSTLVFFIWERVKPGRELPHSEKWYLRAIFINLIQLLMIGLAGISWNVFFRNHALFQIGNWKYPALEGLFYWFVGTFIFYWWHRLRHKNGWWLYFHQLHHSPSRIEVFTSFYKHPIEIAADSILIGFVIYCIFGGTGIAGAWYALYAATGEYFYHANIKTPHWIGYFLQRPEHHSIHHQFGVHKYNYSDITWWDRMFGTFKDTNEFAKRCGFRGKNEEKIKDILKFKNVY